LDRCVSAYPDASRWVFIKDLKTLEICRQAVDVLWREGNKIGVDLLARMSQDVVCLEKAAVFFEAYGESSCVLALREEASKYKV
jgi:hypothetical protein